MENAVRRIAEQPDAGRRVGLRNILVRVIDDPQDHATNRWFLRCADELDGGALQLLHLIDALGDLAWQNPAMSWERLVVQTQRRKWEIYEVLEWIASEHMIQSEGVMGLLRPGQDPSPFRFRLTFKGASFLRYLRS
jgi:hypothetical protein